MPTLHGKSFIAGVLCESSAHAAHAVNPLDGARLEPAFYDATEDDVNRALEIFGKA